MNTINLTSAVTILDAIESGRTFEITSTDSGVCHAYRLDRLRRGRTRLQAFDYNDERWLFLGHYNQRTFKLDSKKSWLPTHSTRRKAAEYLLNHKLQAMGSTDDALTGVLFSVVAD